MLVTQISGAQRFAPRAARALVGLTRDDLAARIGVSERQHSPLKEESSSNDYATGAFAAVLNKMIEALEDAGVEFREGGVFYARAIPRQGVTIHRRETGGSVIVTKNVRGFLGSNPLPDLQTENPTGLSMPGPGGNPRYRPAGGIADGDPPRQEEVV